MSKIDREDIDALNAVVTVTLEKGEYESKFQAELLKYRKEAHMKGFRKGKTSMSLLKKLFGKKVLADVLNDMLQQELSGYLNREKINILGQPLPSAEQETPEIALSHTGDYVFKFDLGLTPAFEVQGADHHSVFQKYEVKVAPEMLDEELMNGRRRMGNRVEASEDIRDNDLLALTARELEGGEIKEGGVQSEFKLLVDDKLADAVREEFLGKKQGDTLILDPFAMMKDVDEQTVRKYYLDLSEEDEREVGRTFEATIDKVSRIEPVALDQEFFDKYFGPGEVHSEEEARARIEDGIRSHYDGQAEALLYRDMQERLIEMNSMQLPDAFLKRWLKASAEKAGDDLIEREYDRFANNLRWTLIKNKLVHNHHLEVGNEEILNRLRERVRGYFRGGAQPEEELIDSMVYRMLDDNKQFEKIYEDILADKLYAVLEEKVTVEPKVVGVEEFMEIVRQAREEAEKSGVEEPA